MNQNKIYRLAKSSFGILIFPTPVDKKNTFLIKAPSEFHGELYKYLLDYGALTSPIESPSLYIPEGLHTDGLTMIYRLNWDTLELKLLPKRELDLVRAEIVENLMAKKFSKLFQQIDKKDEIIRDIQYRYLKQQECSQCQLMGITDQRLLDFFQGLDRWLN
jgi:hypothetical protein